MTTVQTMLSEGRRTIARYLAVDKAALVRFLSRQADRPTKHATRQPKAA